MRSTEIMIAAAPVVCGAAFDPSASRTEVSMAQRELLEVGHMVGPRLFGGGSNLLIADEGFDVDTASTLAEAREKLPASGCMLLDLVLPDQTDAERDEFFSISKRSASWD